MHDEVNGNVNVDVMNRWMKRAEESLLFEVNIEVCFIMYVRVLVFLMAAFMAETVIMCK